VKSSSASSPMRTSSSRIIGRAISKASGSVTRLCTR
jgi:hypothetical protein